MTTIALNKLLPAKANVRRTGANDGIDELGASIAAHGLLTSLAVHKSARGKFLYSVPNSARRRTVEVHSTAHRQRCPHS